MHRFDYVLLALVFFAVNVNQNEINKMNAEDRSKQANKIWTILIDKINYSTRKTKTEKTHEHQWKIENIDLYVACHLNWLWTAYTRCCPSSFYAVSLRSAFISRIFFQIQRVFFSWVWLRCNPFHSIWNIALLNANSLIHLPIDFQSEWNEFNTFVRRSIYIR